MPTYTPEPRGSRVDHSRACRDRLPACKHFGRCMSPCMLVSYSLSLQPVCGHTRAVYSLRVVSLPESILLACLQGSLLFEPELAALLARALLILPLSTPNLLTGTSINANTRQRKHPRNQIVTLINQQLTRVGTIFVTYKVWGAKKRAPYFLNNKGTKT